MASDWRFVDVDLLLRCLPFMATRDVGRVLSTCDAWRGCGEKKEVWSVLLVRHGWRRRPAASEEEEASDGDAEPALDNDKSARIMELMHAAIAKGVAPNEAAEMAMQQAEQES